MLFPLALLAAPLVSGAFVARDVHHEHTAKRALPGTWYQARDHPVHQLFKRGPTTDGIQYAEVGSPTWSAAYPVRTPDVNQMPQAWLDALAKAEQEGKIPNVPQTTNTPQTNPKYPAGHDPMSPEVCSATYKCRIPGDVWDTPDGHFGTGFDDGPEPSSVRLIDFLQENGEDATHFMIGVNILNNPQTFLHAFNSGGDLALHTYTHPYMTTLDNKNIVAQLAWTMEIIHNSTGGRIPRYWRPPYGDYDVRVRAVAREVLGLEVILWNHDTEDWSIASGGTTMQAVNSSMSQWLAGPKSPGLIILEHEHHEQAVQAFIDAFPHVKANGWQMGSVARLAGGSVYQNEDASGNVVPALVAGPIDASQVNSGTSSSTGSSSAPRSSSSSAATTSSGSNTGAAKNGAAAHAPASISAFVASGVLAALAFLAQ
ncbi:hypothetical protein HGRIS_010039 [Hohenbuehelia grisea]|uniref:chitin deacetylase n=1 Tax=Hohenbuehelia grisea TaxID=104357 RepID=A0ABR3J3B5_9AGAR